MAYIVSQLRKTGVNTYMTPIEVTPGTITSPNTFGGTNTFTDFALKGNFLKDQVYYLRFKIHKIPQYFYSGSHTQSEVQAYMRDADSLNLQILLKNENVSNEQDQTEYPPEMIGTCFVPTDPNRISTSYGSYSFVFSPSRNFDSLGFRITRVSYDAIVGSRNWLIDTLKEGDEISKDDMENITRYTQDPQHNVTISTIGRRIFYNYDKTSADNNRDGDICRLEDLVPMTPAKNFGWLKFGYQCRPGSLIVVNKEPIRLGRSGIYEINNGTLIEHFMIASPRGNESSNIDAFLLDYAYKTQN